MLAKLKNYFPYLLPLLLIFSRSIADITIVLISILFLYYSFKKIGWGWLKEKWFLFALFFSAYGITLNSAMSIDAKETFAYSLFFMRWPIFSMALAYWILSDLKSLKKFLISLTLLLLFIIFVLGGNSFLNRTFSVLKNTQEIDSQVLLKIILMLVLG